MEKNRKQKQVGCSVETTLKVIGGKWKVLIIHFLIDDTQRFGELGRLLGTISTRTLSKQLRELEADGIVQRYDFQENPPHVEYSLTPLGKSLKPVLHAMESWGKTVELQGKTRPIER